MAKRAGQAEMEGVPNKRMKVFEDHFKRWDEERKNDAVQRAEHEKRMKDLHKKTVWLVENVVKHIVKVGNRPRSSSISHSPPPAVRNDDPLAEGRKDPMVAFAADMVNDYLVKIEDGMVDASFQYNGETTFLEWSKTEPPFSEALLKWIPQMLAKTKTGTNEPAQLMNLRAVAQIPFSDQGFEEEPASDSHSAPVTGNESGSGETSEGATGPVQGQERAVSPIADPEPAPEAGLGIEKVLPPPLLRIRGPRLADEAAAAAEIAPQGPLPQPEKRGAQEVREAGVGIEADPKLPVLRLRPPNVDPEADAAAERDRPQPEDRPAQESRNAGKAPELALQAQAQPKQSQLLGVVQISGTPFGLVDVPKDGSCLFHAFAEAYNQCISDDGLDGYYVKQAASDTWNDVLDLRETLVSQLRYAFYQAMEANSEGDLETVSQILEKEGAFGTADHAQIIADCYGVEIYIYANHTRNLAGPWNLTFVRGRYPNTAISLPQIHLGIATQFTHYYALIPANDGYLAVENDPNLINPATVPGVESTIESLPQPLPRTEDDDILDWTIPAKPE